LYWQLDFICVSAGTIMPGSDKTARVNGSCVKGTTRIVHTLLTVFVSISVVSTSGWL